jgi:hypothetical protein
VSKSIPVAEVSYDEKKWTKERRVDISTFLAEEYYSKLAKEIYKKYGFEGTNCNNDQMKEMARKYVPRALKNFHIVGNDCRTVAAYFKLVDKIVFDTDFEVLEDTPRRVVLRGSTGCPLARFPQFELCPEMCENGQGHELVACEIINPEIKFVNISLMSAGDESCTMAFELPESAPLSDVSVPVSLYKLDEEVWPEERRKRARQRRGWENYGVMAKALYRRYGKEGMEAVYKVTSEAADNYVIMSLKNYNLLGNDARTVGGYYKLLHEIIFENELEIVEDTPDKVMLRNSGFCPLSANPQEDLTPEMCLSSMGHEHKACEIINPKLKLSVPSLRSAGQPYCEYVFEL